MTTRYQSPNIVNGRGPGVLASGDVPVFPPVTPSLGVGPFEALTAGLPVVSADCGAAAGIAEHDFGYVAEPPSRHFRWR